MSSSDAVSSLQEAFPTISQEVLLGVLQFCDGNVEAAAGYILEHSCQDLPFAAGLSAGAVPIAEAPTSVPAPAVAAPVAIEDNSSHDDEPYDLEEDDDDFYAGEDSEDEYRPPKRRKISVEATPADALKEGDSRFLVKFDRTILRKSHLELLNVMVSRVAHHSVTVWRETTLTEETASLPGQRGGGGYFAHYFPIADVDHVWRMLLNVHLCKRGFGSVVRFLSNSFDVRARETGAVLIYVDEINESEIERIGVALLGVTGEKAAFFRMTPSPEHRRKGEELDREHHIIRSCYKVERCVNAAPGRVSPHTASRLLRNGCSPARKMLQSPRRRVAAPPAAAADSQSPSRKRARVKYGLFRVDAEHNMFWHNVTGS